MTEQITVYSTTWCPDCKRAKKFFNDHRIQYKNIDIEKDSQAMAYVKEVNQGMRIIPTIVFPDGSILTEPSNAELAEKLGIKTKASQKSYDAIVIGAGPSGLTAALYMTREGIDVLVIEKASIGGQIGVTQTLENYPGYDEGINGAEFADRLGRQARKFGAEILEAQEVTNISREGIFWMVETADGSSYNCKAILISTGARYRRLNIPGEEELMGVNVHFCATCDGAFYKGKKVLVIGGGNSGFEEGLFLTKFADQVDIVEFLPQIKASQILRESVERNPKMSVTVNHSVKEFIGENNLEKVLVEDRATGEIKEWEYDGVFVFIGLTPNSDLVENLVEIDKHGFVLTDKTLMTSQNGLFASGDVRAYSTKQAAAAAGEGVTAALMMRQYLDEVG
ncbi:MAG: FAD-dependent oxidoreductase [Anaerolineales bacterium]|jgi:thioredoxin reductase (NADPH)